MAAEQLDDEEKKFRVRARRRLVGAIALVLLMVTVLPMVLDDHDNRNTVKPEIAIDIPSQENSNFSSSVVPTSPTAATSQQTPAPLDKPQEAVAAPGAPSPQANALPPAGPAKQGVAGAEKSASDLKPPVPKPLPGAPVAAQGDVPQGSAKSAVNNDQPVNGAVASSTPVADTPKKGTYSVQVGVFSDPAKIKKLRDEFSKGGLESYTEQLNTAKGAKTRLRCGPYPTKPEAQAALEKLKVLGYGGILVTNP